MESWWHFLRFYPKKNKILSVNIKDKFCNSTEALQLLKRDSNFSLHIPKVLVTAFLKN